MRINLTYKQKNKALIVGTVLLVWMGYSFSVKDTLSIHSHCNELEKRLQLASNAPARIKQIEMRLTDIERLSVNDSDKVSTQQKLLNFVSGYCQGNNVVLREFPKTSLQQQNGLSIETNTFLVEGNYGKLLNLIYMLEQKNRIGQVASVEFSGKKDFKTKRIVLTAKIFLQNIISNDQPNSN